MMDETKETLPISIFLLAIVGLMAIVVVTTIFFNGNRMVSSSDFELLQQAKEANDFYPNEAQQNWIMGSMANYVIEKIFNDGNVDFTNMSNSDLVDFLKYSCQGNNGEANSILLKYRNSEPVRETESEKDYSEAQFCRMGCLDTMKIVNGELIDDGWYSCSSGWCSIFDADENTFIFANSFCSKNSFPWNDVAKNYCNNVPVRETEPETVDDSFVVRSGGVEMTTFNGVYEDLEFSCNHCAGGSKIVINPINKEDLLKLGKWLLLHSAAGGMYNNVPAKNSETLQRIRELEKELEDLKESLQ